jgi:hypothetical protein
LEPRRKLLMDDHRLDFCSCDIHGGTVRRSCMPSSRRGMPTLTFAGGFPAALVAMASRRLGNETMSLQTRPATHTHGTSGVSVEACNGAYWATTLLERYTAADCAT